MDNKDIARSLQSQIDSILSGEGSGDVSFEQHVGLDFEKEERSASKKRCDAECVFGSEYASNGSESAFSKLVELVNYREHSVAQLRKKLATKGFEASEIEGALDRAVNANIVNDSRFAEMLIRSRVNQGKGFDGIARELRENAIDPDAIPGFPYEFGYSDEAEYERAYAAIERKPPHSKNPRNSAFQRLVRSGYSISVASAASRDWVYDQCHLEA